MKSSRGRFITIVIATVATVTCGENSSPTAPTTTTPSTQTVTSLSVSASAITLSVGGTATVTATATYSDGTSGTVDPNRVDWLSSEESVATVNDDGTVTAVAAGTATITGTHEGQSDSVEVTVTATTSTFESANNILARCPTPEEVARSDSDLTLSFEGDPTVGQSVCSAAQSSRDLTLLEAQAYRVLTIMRHLEFDAPLPWTSNSLYEWMVSAIWGIRFRSDIGGSFCCTDNMINIQTNNLSALTDPTEFRWVAGLLVLFVHEARHTFLPHTCGSNDNTIDELGAWGVQYYTYLFLGSHSDPAFITPADQSEFMSRAQQTCHVRFCQDTCP